MKCLPAILILLCVAAKPVELTPAERAAFAAEQMLDVASLGKNLASEPPRRLHDVLDFTFENGRLLPTTSLQGEVMAIQPLVDDAARCIVVRMPLQLDPPVPDGNRPYTFEFQLKRFDSKTLVVESVQITRIDSLVSMGLTLVGTEQSQFLQYSDMGALDENGEPAGVTLYWQTLGTDSAVIDGDGDQPASPTASFSAANFTELIRKHREALPMLRRLFLSVQRPDIIAKAMENVWIRVAKSQLELPDDLVKQVNKLVQQLDSNEYADRQNAFDALSIIGEPARLVLITIDSNTLSDEQRSAVSALLEPVGEVEAAELHRIFNSAIELVDGLYANSPIVREAIRKQIESLAKIRLEIDTSATPSMDVIEPIRASIEKISDQP
ncbi:MAG TPA: hypothetical protein PK402_07195 [Tepidisphaeraceae bacterium]|nr:hypothetical protein [Tepidisphaeraceae bacterium]